MPLLLLFDVALALHNVVATILLLYYCLLFFDIVVVPPLNIVDALHISKLYSPPPPAPFMFL